MHRVKYKKGYTGWVAYTFGKKKIKRGCKRRPPMTPSSEHMWSLDGSMSMTLMLSICHGLLSHKIWTQSSIYGIILNDAWDIIFHIIKQVWVDWLSHGRMVPHPSCRIPVSGGLCHRAYRPYRPHVVTQHPIKWLYIGVSIFCPLPPRQWPLSSTRHSSSFFVTVLLEVLNQCCW